MTHLDDQNNSSDAKQQFVGDGSKPPTTDNQSRAIIQSNIESATGPVHTGSGNININELSFKVESPESQKDRHTRRHLLSFMRRKLVENIFSQALYDNQLLSLQKESVPSLVDHPWRWSGTGVEMATMASNDSILAIFRKMSDSLLIVGTSGAGKTITLIELAKALLSLADNNIDQPVPVYFNLSRWHSTQDMATWLKQELQKLYSVDSDWSSRWLGQATVLLLDGLNEVKQEEQAACIRAINALNFPSIVVCCREEDYQKLPIKLKLRGAIRLLPLTQSQVDRHLAGGGLGTILATSASLQKLASSPLMLNIMRRLDFAGQTLHETLEAQAPLSTLQSSLFDAYIDRMFNRVLRSGHEPSSEDVTTENRPFTQEAVVTWLAWLAQALTVQGLTSFLVEEIQPSWLPKRDQQRRYFLLSRTLIGAILGIWLALFIDWSRLNSHILFTMLLSAGAGLLGGLVAGILEGRSATKDSHKTGTGHLSQIRSSLYVGLPVFITVELWWLLGGLVSGAFFWDELIQSPAGNLLTGVLGAKLAMIKWAGILLAGALSGLFDALVISSSFVLLSNVRQPDATVKNDIQTVETFDIAPWSVIFQSAVRWSGGGIVLGGFFALVLGLMAGLGGTFVAYNGRLLDDLNFSPVVLAVIVAFLFIVISFLISTLVFGVLGILLGSIIGTLSGTRIQADAKQEPNEGIHRSGKNGLWTGVMAWGSSWLLSTVAFWPIVRLLSRFQAQVGWEQTLFGSAVSTLSLAVPIGLFVGLWYGGMAYIKHYTLRFLLWREEKLPKDIVRLLDYGVDRIFLHRIGGEYRFFHQELQMHFASLHKKDKT